MFCAVSAQRAQLYKRWPTAGSTLSGTHRCLRSKTSLLQNLQQRPPLAFAFDIDGVLIRGNQVIPQAKKALKTLQGDNPLGIEIPFILVTNGGGISESVRCQSLSQKLGVEIPPSRYMQAHTILKSVVDEYLEKPVLVVGGKPGVVLRVAEEYGFRKVYTTLDILAWNPRIWPFHELDADERAFVETRAPFDPSTRFSAAFIFHDPRNWGLDIQILCDILRNNGQILPHGQQQSTPSTSDARQDVKLVFCNPDLLWGSDFPVPRVGQGGFRIAFQAVYMALTGNPYPYIQYGKPTPETYSFAEQMLRGQLRTLLDQKGMAETYDDDDDYKPNVYMIGDNPESDIAGANQKGWTSVLVRTGVYDPACGPPSHKPTHISVDVEEAVNWAIEREFSRLRSRI